MSSDSDTPMQDMVRAAIDKGLAGITFTEHVDIDFPGHDISFDLDYGAYEANIAALRRQYPHFPILMGVELGSLPGIGEKNARVVSEHPFDIVINSVHAVDNLDVYLKKFFVGRTRAEAFVRYLEDVLYSTTAYASYNVLGHIGFVSKSAPYDDPTLRRSDAPDIVDAILKNVIAQGRGIEINTSGYRTTAGALPGEDIVRRYRALGGEIITLGSDAHIPPYVGYHFNRALDMLAACGFRYVAHFVRMEPVMTPIAKVG